MNNKNDIIDIENFDNELENIARLSGSIQSNFQAIVFDFTNKISNNLGDNLITNTRTDLLFRINAIFYFIKLMKREELILLSYISENAELDETNRIQLSFDHIQIQKSIFDTVLYHLSSLYDYFANMSGYLYNGKGVKWNGLFQSANDPQNDKIGESQKQLITKSHKNFVDSLFSHRSYLIHQSTSHPGFKYTHNLSTGVRTVIIITPSKFIKEFKLLKEAVGDKEITLIGSMFWVVKFGFENINELLFGMKEELQRLRKIEKGNEVITDNRFPNEDISTPYWKNE